MAKDGRQVPVSFDDATLTELNAYCEFFSLDPNELINSVLGHFLENHQSADFNQLAQGYLAMGQLNEEIADEFSATEAEVARLDR
ncbi:antitoxin [Furfurilactobacillus curtus]|uniref:Antitoxin n=1 Tax=Furfurilactobacillus curtus TaxID=1746200 RepID=A0ABQ5JNN0_9LACO